MSDGRYFFAFLLESTHIVLYTQLYQNQKYRGSQMLTKRQKETYEIIKKYIGEHGYAPTTLEIAHQLEISSKGVVHRYVKALETANLVTLIPNRKRNITLNDVVFEGGGEIPLQGKIAAGCPIEAIPEQETVDLGAITGPNRYALRVCGNSMVEEGIHDGDLVICDARNQANNGEIVVALIDNECATLKRFHRNDDGTVTLIPANADYLPMVYEAHRVMIQGIFIGLLRIHQ